MYRGLRHTPPEAPASRRELPMNLLHRRHTVITGRNFQEEHRQIPWDQESKFSTPLIHSNSLSLQALLGGSQRVSDIAKCLLSFSLPFEKGSIENDIRKQATFLFTPVFLPAPNPVHAPVHSNYIRCRNSKRIFEADGREGNAESREGLTPESAANRTEGKRHLRAQY